jgi:hypothetical protein
LIASARKRTMFDRSWRRMPFTITYQTDSREVTRPISLSRMIEAAEQLSERMSFVRIDFYEIAGEPRFGEMTLYPGSGLEHFDPPDYNKVIGKLWR